MPAMETRSEKTFSLKDVLILLGCVLIMATTMGIVNVVLSIFYPAVSGDLGVSRASFALTGTITALSTMVAALFWGYHYSKRALRTTMLISTIIFGLAFLGMSLAKNLFHFYALALVIGVTFGGISIIPVSIIITRHFTKNTGFILSAALAGSGLGAMVLNPIINTIINNAGWQAGYRLIAVVVFAATLPCAIMVTSLTSGETQTDKQSSDVSAKTTESKSPFKQAWLWAFLSAAFLAGLTGGGVLANLPTYLNDLKFSVSHVSFVTSAYSASLVLGKFVLGFLYDRLGAKIASAIAGLLMALSLVLMMVIELPVMLILMLIAIGVGLAIGTVSITWLANFFFSKEDYSKYYGTVQFANSFGIAVGVPTIASALETLANTNVLWIALAVLSMAMVALFLISIRGNQKMKAARLSSSDKAADTPETEELLTTSNPYA